MDMKATAEAALELRAVRLGDRLAALDLGTNNCRLLIAEASVDGFEVIDSFSRIVRLGEGLAASNRLSEAAMARTVSALKVCARIIARHRVSSARCVATEACRRASNGAAFIARVRKVTGLDLEILTQDEEARLAMLGCLPLLDEDSGPCLMVDIGGGSTEILWLDRDDRRLDREPAASVSLPLGVVTLSETFGREVDHDGYRRMVEVVEARLEVAGRHRPLPAYNPRVQMLGTSGTVTTLAAVHLGLKRYDRSKVDGFKLPVSAVRVVSRHLLDLDHAARVAHPCIGSGRADLVVAGCAILEAVHRRWPVEWLRVADRGVREGILSTLVGQSLRDAVMRAGSLA